MIRFMLPKSKLAIRAASADCVFAPSPPVGEGSSEFQSKRMGEGGRHQDPLCGTPHPFFAFEPPSRPLPQGERAKIRSPRLLRPKQKGRRAQAAVLIAALTLCLTPAVAQTPPPPQQQSP